VHSKDPSALLLPQPKQEQWNLECFCLSVCLKKAVCPSHWLLASDALAGTLHAAVHRRAPHSHEAAWAPEEALTPAEALTAHTLAGAAAAGLERELGSIEAGKMADWVLLRGTAGPGDAAAAVQQTYVGGKCMHGC
jgi:N-acetylglucosamine-6-phosphate deacetylase